MEIAAWNIETTKCHVFGEESGTVRQAYTRLGPARVGEVPCQSAEQGVVCPLGVSQATSARSWSSTTGCTTTRWQVGGGGGAGRGHDTVAAWVRSEQGACWALAREQRAL